MLGSRPRRESDLFDAIAANLLNQTQMITAPGAVDTRWPAIIAQAFREGLGKIASRHRGGVLFRTRPDGIMDIIALDGEIED